MTSKKHKNNKSYWVEDTPEKLDYINQTLYEENVKLKKDLTKHKMAFEIFKRLDGPGRALLIAAIFDIATDEEYELLEELMRDEIHS